jgi:hypothetical protein
MRMGALYLVGAWAALQVADLLVGLLELADGTLRILTLVLLAGFPVALIASWFYELTPDGLRRDFRGDGAAMTKDDPRRAAPRVSTTSSSGCSCSWRRTGFMPRRLKTNL